MITPEPPAGSEHYREGWRHGYEQAAIDRERPADAGRLVPDTAGRCGDIGDLLFNERYCCELRAGHAGWHREGVTEWSGVVDRRGAGAVPDTGQADEVLKLRWEVQQLQGIVQDQQRGIAAVRSLCADAMKLPTLEDPRPADDRVSPRAVLAALDRGRAVPDTGQAPESPTDSTPKSGRCGSGEAETTTDTVQAPDVAALLRRLAELAERWELPLTKRTEAVALAYCTAAHDLRRALLGTDTTPDRLAWTGTAAETAAAERQARYQETACALRPAATSGDPAQPDLAYARSEVDKWLADNAPYCILPTRTEHIPALLARLDELEGTS